MHGIVQGFVYAVIKFLELCDLSAALCSQRTVFAVAFAASVNIFLVAFAVGFGSFEKQQRMVSATLLAFVAVSFLIENKSFSFGFVLSEVWDVGVDAFFFAVFQALATAVACICKDFFGLHPIQRQILKGLIHYLRENH